MKKLKTNKINTGKWIESIEIPLVPKMYFIGDLIDFGNYYGRKVSTDLPIQYVEYINGLLKDKYICLMKRSLYEQCSKFHNPFRLAVKKALIRYFKVHNYYELKQLLGTEQIEKIIKGKLEPHDVKLLKDEYNG